jgi:hypothetical protein
VVVPLVAFPGYLSVITMNLLMSAAVSDEELWQSSREGDRDAFSRIVERYQTLVCSLAYSACGDLAISEDLAKETFLTAWRRLGDLREPMVLFYREQWISRT